MRARTLLLFALGALGGCRLCTRLDPFADASDAEADAAAPLPPPFACGAALTGCGRGEVPAGAALAREIRTKLAKGAVAEASALVACARARGDDIRLEPEPGLESVVFSPEGARLLAEQPARSLLRVFDPATATETMRVDHVEHPVYDEKHQRFSEPFAVLHDGLLVVPRTKEAPARVWSTTTESAVAVDGLPEGAAGASDRHHWMWAVDPKPPSAVLLVRAEQVRRGGFTSALRVPLPFARDEGASVLEIGGGTLLVTNRGSRWAFVDETSGAVRKSVTTTGRLSVVLPNAAGLVFDEGELFEGMDFPFLAPSHAPLLVPVDGNAARLSGAGCATSVAIAASPDGNTLLTQSKDAYCTFDLPSRKLLGTVPTPDGTWGLPLPVGAFVSDTVAVTSRGPGSVVLTLAPRGQQPIATLRRAEGSFLGALPLDPNKPTTSALLAATDGQTGAAQVSELLADGTAKRRDVPLAFVGGLGAGTPSLVGGAVIGDPPRLVGANQHLTGVVSCEARGDAPCLLLPLAGTTVASPDGALVAGPAAGPRAEFRSNAFRGHEPLAIVSPLTGRGHVHDAQGIRAVAFDAAGALAVLGSDGARVTCPLASGRCVASARRDPGAVVVPSAAGSLVTMGRDETLLRTSDETGGPEVAARLAKDLAERFERWTPRRDGIVNAARGLLLRMRDRRLEITDLVKDDTRTLVDRECLVAIDGAGKIAACLSANRVSAVDVDSGAVLHEERWSAPNDAHGDVPGAVALSANGAYLAYATPDALAIVDVAAKKTVAQTKMAGARAALQSVTVDDEGRFAATVLEQTLYVLDRSAPAAPRVVALPSTQTTTLASGRDGHLAMSFSDGSALLVDPQRRVWEITRSSIDAGVWLARDGRVVPRGDVRSTTQSLACRIGASIVPARACLPVLCDPGL